ncbi:unnamed protein product, partial [marine sediment metagenome]
MVYWNDNGGFTNWSKRTASTLTNIVDFAVLDYSTVYALDDNGDVARSDHNGSRWLSAEDSKVDAGHTIAVLGDYVLVGGAEGSVGYSDDGADSFSRLGDKGTLTNNVHVAFDSYFGDNDTVYAAVADFELEEEAGGIYRWVIDDSTSWKDLKARGKEEVGTTEPDNNGLPIYAYYNYYGIVLDNADGNPMTDEDTGGVLYAVYDYYYDDNVSVFYTGMARLLDPCTSPSAAKWDYLINGVPAEETFFDAEPSALRICDSGNSLLWAINTYG